ncbi:hypothetical protein SRABI83_03703 [Arthrobacter sp. Bi83]|uniref:hypothetical protein n=1 Tax=Arthrobacter sp. Bi83 TaxID=2822353 RepID=UPI001E0DB47F|nr:hypothetical protein [Arthrobacter sp. Bi83]CAH0273056.1 hypothetical protein SRABI83_03703 [Arthrobacter sp. Bi83]
MRRSASASSAVTVFSGVCVALLLASCGSPASAPPTTSPAGGSPTASASASATSSPSATPSAGATTPAEGWKTFTTTDGSLSFDYPADWTIKDPAGQTPAGGGAFVEVSKANGKSMATLRTNVVTGAECTKKQPYGMLDSQPLPALAQAGKTPRFAFESRMDPEATDPTKANILAYGITSAPEPTGTEACPIFHFFTWPPSGAMFGGVYNPFDTTPGNEPFVDTPEAYKETAEYRDIRKMITSLRPAG